MDIVLKYIEFLIPLLILNLALLIFALLDIIKRDAQTIRGNNKVIWVLIVVFFNFFGPIAYFLFGRKDS
jgi:hypothetical protein